MSHVRPIVLAFAIGAGADVTGADAHPGRGLVVTEQRVVYVPDAVRSIVWRMVEGTNPSPMVRDVHAHWLALAPPTLSGGDRIFAEHVRYDSARDRFYQRILRVAGDGQTVTMLPENRDGRQIAGCFLVSAEGGFVCAPDGDPPSICRRRVERDASAPLCAEPLVTSGVDGAPKFGTVTAMAWAADGGIAFTDGVGLYILGRSGTVSRMLDKVEVRRDGPDAPPPMKPGEVWGIAWSVGAIFTTEPRSRRVVRVEDGGKTTTIYESESPWFPTGVACAGGDVYVLEHGLIGDQNLGPRVHVITPEKEVRLVAVVEKVPEP